MTFINSLNDALKAGTVIEVELDLYLTEDGRVLRYDRLFHKRPGTSKVCNMWIDDEGNCFENFFNAYHKTTAYRWA